MSVQKNVPRPFHCKPRPSAVSLESPGLEYMPEVPGNRTEVPQNHDARKTVSAILSLLNLGRAIFRPKGSKVSVQKAFLCTFHCKPRPSGVSLEYAEVENIPPVPGNRAQVGQNHDARKAVPANAHRDFDQLRLNFRELGGYFPVPRTLK